MAGAIVLAGSVVVVGERGAFHVGDRQPGGAIPGVTVADAVTGVDAPMAVVTSLRSDGAAERSGLRVGDRIDAIDGQPVRNAADLRRAMTMDTHGRPLALHVRRGDALWTVAIDTAATGGTESHDPQDPAG